MTTGPALYLDSDLDGQEPGGFIVVNVDAPIRNPYQILEGDDSSYFATLTEAREACRRFRQESGHEEIYVYALIGVHEALERHPGIYRLA